MAWDPASWARQCADKHGKVDAVLVLAGGIDDDGKVHSTVARRLEAVAALYALGRVPCVMNGGGTAHKPKWHDAAGFPVPEAILMAQHLVALGVARADIYPEGFSDDTLGNAFFARTMHTEWRPWRRLLLVTSDFQARGQSADSPRIVLGWTRIDRPSQHALATMPRADAVYKWLFALPPAPGPGGVPYEIVSESVPDEGTLPADVLELRRQREGASLVTFAAGTSKTITSMEACQEWLFQQHGAYAVPTKAREALDPSLLKTY